MAEGTALWLSSSSIAETLCGLCPRLGLCPYGSILSTLPFPWASRSSARCAGLRCVCPTRCFRTWLKWRHFFILIYAIVREDGVVAITGLLFFIETLGILWHFLVFVIPA